ncbi:hypothetical protein LVJ94_31830 [Pendulispora rubella]|uniref:GPI inositol-deacylase PGAP1-like alpha/beta domain-containing protein n=1 Tax=Pendulispora rubella TaxID=2741070 RepID=A0ABZ2KYU3_9BACT
MSDDHYCAQRRPEGNAAGWDTCNIDTVPIVFIPGVMGSRLKVSGFLKADWDPDDNFAMVGWALSTLGQKQGVLSVDKTPQLEPIRSFQSEKPIRKNKSLKNIAAALHTDPVKLYEARGWGAVAWSFYGAVLTQLETSLNMASGQSTLSILNPVYAFGYDFRRSNFLSGDKLAEFIEKVLKENPGAKQVILVTHSMGGLVARAALTRNPAIVPKVLGIVHGAQPSNGAVVAYRRFFTGAISSMDGGAIPERTLETIIGSDPVDYTILQVGLPGPLELLPNHTFHLHAKDRWLTTRDEFDLGNIHALYRRSTAPGLVGQFVAAMVANDDATPTERFALQSTFSVRLGLVEDFHKALENAWHPNTHILYSDELKTDARVDWTATQRERDSLEPFHQTPSGDGTVPADSGRCPGIPIAYAKSRKQFAKLEHAGCYKDEAFNQWALDRIRLILSRS